MVSDPARELDPEYPNLRPEVLETYRNAPENLVVEIIDGEISTMPRPAPRHQSSAYRLGGRIGSLSFGDEGAPGVWVSLPEPELKLGALPDIAVPDLAGWRRERLPTMPETATIDVVPDWVCEFLSPSTHRHDRFKKMPMYFRHGVAHAWLVDAMAKTLEVFRRTPDGWLLVLSAGENETVRAEPFETIELPLPALWVW
jgi:Uma2 family endonuclease